MTSDFRLKSQGERVVDMASHERHPRFVGTAQGSAQMLHDPVSGLGLIVGQFSLLWSHRLAYSAAVNADA